MLSCVFLCLTITQCNPTIDFQHLFQNQLIFYAVLETINFHSRTVVLVVIILYESTVRQFPYTRQWVQCHVPVLHYERCAQLSLVIRLSPHSPYLWTCPARETLAIAMLSLPQMSGWFVYAHLPTTIRWHTAAGNPRQTHHQVWKCSSNQQRKSAGYLATVLMARCQDTEVIYFCDL